jgi:hypothetical protein
VRRQKKKTVYRPGAVSCPTFRAAVLMPCLFPNRLGDEHMASVFDVEEQPKAQANRRIALVSFLLSPSPSTLLKIMIAVCGVWTIFVAWLALSVVRHFVP